MFSQTSISNLKNVYKAVDILSSSRDIETFEKWELTMRDEGKGYEYYHSFSREISLFASALIKNMKIIKRRENREEKSGRNCNVVGNFCNVKGMYITHMFFRKMLLPPITYIFLVTTSLSDKSEIFLN